MNQAALSDTARALVAGDKGLLAMDESNATCEKRFTALGIPLMLEARRVWREVILTALGCAQSIGGVIIYDETICQATPDGTPFLKGLADAGFIASIKVDTGAKDFAGCPDEKNHRGAGRIARVAAQICGRGRSGCQMAGGDRHG